ncbi:site-specific DNA-methyltransferase [Agrobacterium pusense]|uniref:site-specific DNA-methyltransferase n=1 Tax=Agrobacterium pusense TaxID=648995 RepID=UPI0024154380|nr:site-specific DNA-methyltransferase [Agrobacterium pusense]WFN88399.1 site-specific DNA-methyltransferase [Agrobacterium pusense]
MKKLELNDPETKSADAVTENLEALQSLFPDAFREGKIDFDVLKQLLGGAVGESDEKYGLNWHGKRKARQIALTPSAGTLLPCPEESVDWDTTQNLMVEGDNLEVLKLLQKTYAGKVKLIYIDPPYNTGNDFIYPDDFTNNIANYLTMTGQSDEAGLKVTSNTESSGRFHTDWLNMMLPRIKLAHSLLASDGAIFISIDDVEQGSLRKLCDEVFGEENFLATIIWQKVFSPKNTAAYFSEDHDYILCFCKNKEFWNPELLPRSEANIARYTNPDNDPRGPWLSGALQARNYYSKGIYTVTSPNGNEFQNPKGTYWRFSKENFHALNREGRIWWGESGGNVPRLKRFLSEVKDGVVPQTLWKYEAVGHTQQAKEELLEYVTFENTENVLNSVKPSRLIQQIVKIGTRKGGDDIVVDFFAGSGPTAHAVLAQNAEDGGARRYILVQIPEQLPKPEEKIKTISDLTTSRLRNVGAKKKAEAKDSGRSDFDGGFRVFKLAQSSIRAWEPVPSDLEGTLLANADHIVPGRTEQDILYELLLKLGLDLCVPIEKKQIVGKTVYAVGGGALIACLADGLSKDVVESLSAGIVAWWNQLAPAVETRVVFKDSGFADDVAKTNMAAILNQNGILDVRSL